MSYHFLHILRRIFTVLPIGVGLFLGKCFGVLLYLFDQKKKRIAYKNIKMVFPRKSSQEIFAIVRASFVNFGLTIIETLASEKIAKENWVTFSMSEPLGGHNVVVGIHSGSWEIYNIFFAQRFNFAILVNPQKNAPLDAFLMYIRRAHNLKVCTSLKELVRCVHDKYWLGLVVDHGAERNAPVIDFFNQRVPTPQGAVYIAQKYNKKIYPAFGYRNKDCTHTLCFSEGIDPRKASKEEVLKKINSFYEASLRAHPENYLWWYKRFKRKKNLRVLVLSDTKAGHLKQSLTVLTFFKELGYTIEEQVVEIAVTNRLKRLVLEVAALFSSGLSIGRRTLLQCILKQNEFRALNETFADVVISTGSTLAPINTLFSHSIGARSVVILKPNLPLNKFDLVFLPEHDRLVAPNAVNIKGALSAPLDTHDARETLMKQFSLNEKPKIAVFIGGALDDRKMFERNLKVFLKNIEQFARENNFGLLVTTSRRTVRACEHIVKKQLSASAALEVLIVANEQNYPFIAAGFLASAQMVFVTSDSISMVSESLGLKKATVCVALEDILSTHHINFFQTVEGLAHFLTYPFKPAVCSEPEYSLFEHNKKVITEAIKRLV